MEAIEPLRRLAEQMCRLTEEFAGQLQSIKERQQQLESEKEPTATSIERSDADMVEINVGGKVMTTRRSTLLLAKGTLLESIFSGRWEQSLERDGAGRIFLDFSPAPFKALLSFLRARRIAEPGEHIDPPVVLPEDKAEFKAMVRYLGLEEFVGLKGRAPYPMPCPVGALVCSPSTGGTSDGSIQCDGGVLRSGSPGWRSAVGGARLLGDDGSLGKVAWKVTVRLLSIGLDWLYAGVIGHSSPADFPSRDSTGFAWGSYTHVRLAGTNQLRHEDWQGWLQGDVAVFHLDISTGLRMYLRRSQRVYSMQGMPVEVMKEARVLFNFYLQGAEVEVSQATAEDLAEAGF